MGTPSERFEILPVFPLGDFQVEAIDFRFLQLAEVINERAAETLAQTFVGTQRIDCIGERARQCFGTRFIGRIGRWRG